MSHLLNVDLVNLLNAFQEKHFNIMYLVKKKETKS